jgi:hypothetical protein
MKGWFIGPLGGNITFQLYILWLVVEATSKWLKSQIQKLLGYEFNILWIHNSHIQILIEKFPRAN